MTLEASPQTTNPNRLFAGKIVLGVGTFAVVATGLIETNNRIVSPAATSVERQEVGLPIASVGALAISVDRLEAANSDPVSPASTSTYREQVPLSYVLGNATPAFEKHTSRSEHRTALLHPIQSYTDKLRSYLPAPKSPTVTMPPSEHSPGFGISSVAPLTAAKEAAHSWDYYWEGSDYWKRGVHTADERYNVQLIYKEAQRQGQSNEQIGCLDNLWTKESNDDTHTEGMHIDMRTDLDRETHGAYGIPQALPGRKMARFGSDWRDNPLTQIKWGLWYIADRYSTPCSAWEHSQHYNYY